jgi:1-acyl-sn-glycerol-3-phosphate acyltransferase
LLDLCVTIACWGWFTLGFVVFFSWRYLAATLDPEPEKRFQELNSRFYRSLFSILRLLAPSTTWQTDPSLTKIKSAVIVCNHLSYLDPLLLIALFPRHRTIVKTRLFSMPIMGWVVRRCGYLPATTDDSQMSRLMIERVESMEVFFADGGNLFVFPEGTRSRNGGVGRLNPGALKIARMFRVPVYVLEIRNTDRLFAPNSFLFKSREANTISIRLRDTVEPDRSGKYGLSLGELERRVQTAFAGAQA